jgi:hypothetical protein
MKIINSCLLFIAETTVKKVIILSISELKSEQKKNEEKEKLNWSEVSQWAVPQISYQFDLKPLFV